MKTLKKGMCAAVLALAAAAAFAVPITDVVNPQQGITITTSRAYGFDHIITDNGFNAALDTIVSALLTISVQDPANDHESYTFRIGSGATEQVLSGTDVNGARSFPVTLVASLADLQADGILHVLLSATAGDYKFTSSTLTAEVQKGVENTSVPEPGMLALLGIGLIGFGAARRRNK